MTDQTSETPEVDALHNELEADGSARYAYSQMHRKAADLERRLRAALAQNSWREVATDELPRLLGEIAILEGQRWNLIMLVKRLSRALNLVEPQHEVSRQAMEYVGSLEGGKNSALRVAASLPSAPAGKGGE